MNLSEVSSHYSHKSLAFVMNPGIVKLYKRINCKTLFICLERLQNDYLLLLVENRFCAPCLTLGGLGTETI